MWCEHPTGQLAEDKQPTCRHANVSTLLGEDMLDVGQAPGFEPCSCLVLNWELETSDQRNQSEHGLGSLLLFWRKYPMIWRGFKGASGGFSLILTVADAKRCSHRITSDLEKTHFTNFYFFSRRFSFVVRPMFVGHLSSLSPAYSHMPKDYYSIMTA